MKRREACARLGTIIRWGLTTRGICVSRLDDEKESSSVWR